MEMDPPPPPAPVLTPKSFVSSVKGKDLRYHVLVTIKRWFQGETKEKTLEDLPPLPLTQRKLEDTRRFYPCDMEAWNQLELANVSEEFMWQTMKRLRYKLQALATFEMSWITVFLTRTEIARSDCFRIISIGWTMKAKSEIEEDAGCDKNGNMRVYKPDGRLVVYMDCMEVELAPAEDRKLLDVDYFYESDDSDVSDDPFHRQVPDMWPCSSGVGNIFSDRSLKWPLFGYIISGASCLL